MVSPLQLDHCWHSLTYQNFTQSIFPLSYKHDTASNNALHNGLRQLQTNLLFEIKATIVDL